MTADPIGGVWTYALDLADGLEPYGVELVLATMGAPLTADQRDAALGRANVRLYESTYRVEWMDDPWVDVDRAGEWLLDLAAAEGAQIVHLNGYAHASLPWPVPAVVVAHSCVCSWWEAVRGGDAPPHWHEYRRRVRAGLEAADAIVAPTRAMLGALGRHYGDDVVAGGRVIANGRVWVRPHGTASREPIVLGVGRLWDDAKNLATLARVAPALPWPVYVAGDARPPAGAGGAALEAGAVRSLGRLEANEVAAWMERAAIYALPARYEPFGLSALEAALAGCALVLGDIPSLREVWDDSALFVPPDDDHALADAIARLARDERGRRRLADAAHERARRYTPQRMAAEYHALYLALPERGSQSPRPQEELACAS
jgi:glycosyltransferase involved in cell wall biosynthesis